MNWGWFILGAGVVGGAVYLSRLNKFSQNLESVLAARIHKIGLNGITVAVNAQLKNPTKTGIKMKFPFVKIMYNGNTLATSQTVNQDIEVPRFGEALVEDIMITLNYSSLLLNAMEVYKSLQEKKPIIVQAKIMTYIYTLAGLQPYERTENITLAA